jgi:hypothetical protein
VVGWSGGRVVGWCELVAGGVGVHGHSVLQIGQPSRGGDVHQPGGIRLVAVAGGDDYGEDAPGRSRRRSPP